MKSTIIRNVPISKLALSPFNVRRTPPTEEEANELKASILATGIAQNLVVHSKREKGKETFFVAAGGRRLGALQALLADNAIKDTFEVPVRIVPAKEAEEISLVENVQRSSMHPADEFEAFARLIEAGSTIEQVANRFGTTPLAVERRMKLGKLHPDLLQFYRDGEMTLEVCKALVLTNDHERQMQAWDATEGDRRYHHNGVQHSIRRILTADAMNSTTQIGQLVDLDLYEREGGTFERDLFAGRDGSDVVVSFENVALAEKLALAKLEEIAVPLRTQWKWVDVQLEPDHHRSGWSKLSPIPLDVPEELATEHDRVADRIAELEGITEEEDWTEELDAELDGLYPTMRELSAKVQECLGFTTDQKAASGVIVSAGHKGPQLSYGVLNPDDIIAIETANRAAAEEAERVRLEAEAKAEAATTNADDNTAADDNDGEHDPAPDASVEVTRAPAPAILPGQPHGLTKTAKAIETGDVETDAKDAPLHSQALDLDLRHIRRQILQAHVANDFGSAFDMLLWQMAKGVMSTGWNSAAPLAQQFGREYAGPDVKDKLEGTAAEAMLKAQEEQLITDWMKLDAAEGFAAMCALSDEDKQALFAWCVSTMMVPSSNEVIEAIGTRLGIRVEQFWRPTADIYWNRVKKDVSIDVAREVIDQQWANDHKAQKKGDLARSMERVFAHGQGVGIDNAKLEAAKAWLPVGMAFASTDEPLPIGADGTTNEVETSGDDSAEIIEVPAFLRGAA